jgi:hypothetical protein
VDPDVGVSAWIDCAGHLPWGLSVDQREDDARSLVWEWPAEQEVLLGHPTARLQVSADAPAASLSAKLCDVSPDGVSVLVSRGTLDLAYRDGVHAPRRPSPLVPGEVYDVEVVLDACGYELAPGHRLRLSAAGSDWPNTVAPASPVRLTVHGGVLDLPIWTGNDRLPPTFTPGAETSSEEPSEVAWTVTRDVLRRTTTCAVRHGADYDTPHQGTASERYAGEVVVDRRSFAQRAAADCSFTLTWPGVELTVRSTMQVDVTASGYDVTIAVDAYDGGEHVSHRDWREHVPR